MLLSEVAWSMNLPNLMGINTFPDKLADGNAFLWDFCLLPSCVGAITSHSQRILFFAYPDRLRTALCNSDVFGWLKMLKFVKTLAAAEIVAGIAAPLNVADQVLWQIQMRAWFLGVLLRMGRLDYRTPRYGDLPRVADEILEFFGTVIAFVRP